METSLSHLCLTQPWSILRVSCTQDVGCQEQHIHSGLYYTVSALLSLSVFTFLDHSLPCQVKNSFFKLLKMRLDPCNLFQSIVLL